jgi:hypothetical protein
LTQASPDDPLEVTSAHAAAQPAVNSDIFECEMEHEPRVLTLALKPALQTESKIQIMLKPESDLEMPVRSFCYRFPFRAREEATNLMRSQFTDFKT